MSRGQKPRTPAHFPRMRDRGQPRRMRWEILAEGGTVMWRGNHRTFMKRFGRTKARR